MAPPAVGLPLPRTRVRVRRNPRWLAAGILAVALGGLATAFLFMSIADTTSVIKLNKTIYRGQVVAASDLSVVTIGKANDLKVIAGARINEVVGKNAVTDLPQGSLLVDGSLGKAELAKGFARVGLKLAAGRLPSTAMAPGTPLLVVALPSASGAAPGQAATLPPSIEATLTSTPTLASDGSAVLDLDVPASSAEQVARLASVSQVAVIRRAEG